jgi:hypothetical protein
MLALSSLFRILGRLTPGKPDSSIAKKYQSSLLSCFSASRTEEVETRSQTTPAWTILYFWCPKVRRITVSSIDLRDRPKKTNLSWTRKLLCEFVSAMVFCALGFTHREGFCAMLSNLRIRWSMRDGNLGKEMKLTLETLWFGLFKN